MSTADDLEKLHRLRVEGALTDGEFAAQKARLLSQPGDAAAQAAPRPAGRMSILAIVAFALSFVLGPLGSVLGIVAVIVVATSKGRLRGLGFAISGICVGFFFWGILAAIAIPSFINYVRKAKSAEATLNVDRLYESAAAYYAAERTGPDGEVAHRLPQGTDWTPATPCCGQGGGEGRCGAAANAGAWATPAWQALGFSMSDDFRYQYRLAVDGGGIRAQAQGDLDCDGRYSLFERAGSANGAGAIQGSPGILETDPLE